MDVEVDSVSEICYQSWLTEMNVIEHLKDLNQVLFVHSQSLPFDYQNLGLRC